MCLASSAGCDVGKQEGTLRALMRGGYVHWASGRISQIILGEPNVLPHTFTYDPFDKGRQQSPMAVAGKEWRLCDGTFSHL